MTMTASFPRILTVCPSRCVYCVCRYSRATRKEVLDSVKQELDDLKITSKDIKHWWGTRTRRIQVTHQLETARFQPLSL
jgi:hypothetical protein